MSVNDTASSYNIWDFISPQCY